MFGFTIAGGSDSQVQLGLHELGLSHFMVFKLIEGEAI